MKTLFTASTLAHNTQRYPTVGDWVDYGDSHGLGIKVSEMSDADSEFLVALHELVEAYLCKKAGITDEQVTAFDKAFERNRPYGNVDEPGDDSASPYKHEHRIATIVEMIVADAAGVDWKKHEENVNALF